jgi:FkbM family methyltransferase
VAGGPAAGARLSLAHLPPVHSQARELARGSLEPNVQRILATLIEPGFVVYDIGANVGFFTVLAARLTGPMGSVYSLEPAPHCAAAVAANAELNGLANVTVLQRAAGRAAGRERLYVVADQSWSHLESRGRHPLTTDALEVEVAAIDDLVAGGELPPPDLVKLDVEGSEVDVLAGMRRTIAEHRPRVVCELHETAAEIAALCEQLGMRGRSLDGPEPLAQAGANAHVLLEPA